MAGHSKWAQIKRKKAVTDAARSKLFSKYARLISVESKRAQGDTNDPQLRAVMERAKADNMTKDAIERAVAKGVGGDSSTLERIVYEMYGPGGVAILIETLTDSRNRTVAEIKHLVSKRGFELANPGSAQWAFQKEGDTYTATTTVKLGTSDEPALVDLLDALEEHDDVQEVFTNATE